MGSDRSNRDNTLLNLYDVPVKSIVCTFCKNGKPEIIFRQLLCPIFDHSS